MFSYFSRQNSLASESAGTRISLSIVYEMAMTNQMVASFTMNATAVQTFNGFYHSLILECSLKITCTHF